MLATLFLDDVPYRIVLLLHILSAMVAFAPAFTHPFLTNQSKGMPAHTGFIGLMSANGRRIYAPAVILTGILGFALQGMSDGLIKFDQFWFIGAIVVWIAMNGVLHGMLLPNERKMADGDASAQKTVDMAGAIITVLLLVMLYLMVFKPGL